MKGREGDCSIYTDRSGNEHRAILQSETMNGNARLIFWDGEEPDKESLRFAINIPHKDDTANTRNVYKHKPSAEWEENFI